MEKIPRQKESNLLRIVLFGPESTGKTTLSKELAAHYKTNWVPEFARNYLQEKWDTEGEICEADDIIPIAIGQINSENKLSETANKLLFYDTNLLETKVYCEVYYNDIPKELNVAIEQTNYDLYLLTYTDTPWVADDLRDKPNEREEMFKHFERTLILNAKNYILLKGDRENRFNKSVSKIDELLKNR